MQNYFYSSIFFNKLTQKLQKNGNKEKIEGLIQKIILIFARRGLKIKWIFIFFEVLTKIKPFIKLNPQFLNKQKVFVPTLISTTQQYKLGLDWVVKDIRNVAWKVPLKVKLTMYFENIYLHNEKFDKRKDDYYEMVLKYRSYKRYRW